MLFHEIYGAYFQTVARILREAGKSGNSKDSENNRTRGNNENENTNGISGKRMVEIISESAFAESTLVIPDKLQSGAWPLLMAVPGRSAGNKGQTAGQAARVSVLQHAPTRPLSLLEKQWLKSLLDDPRLRLFLDEEADGTLTQLRELLKDVPPLFEPESVEYYDRYSDGDDYTDEGYIDRFHKILRAIREKQLISVEYENRHGIVKTRHIYPYGMEYSAKDDKFRVLCTSRRGGSVITNMGRIRSCKVENTAGTEDLHGTRQPAGTEDLHGTRQPAEIRKHHVDLLLTDERNALPRAMLHFSDLQKETERIDETHYRIRLWYREDDETEILIRILAYGPMLKVTAPARFASLVRERIEKQLSCEL